MVKAKDNMHLEIPPQSLLIPDGSDTSLPVTPINRAFGSLEEDSYITAITSPSSHQVFAARARARSRSDVPPVRSSAVMCASAVKTVHYSPSLDSINATRACETIKESETSPPPSGGQTPFKPIFDSPTIARRSRILSSSGAATTATRSTKLLGPFTLIKADDNQNPEAHNLAVNPATSHRLAFNTRPRASTLSLLNPTQHSSIATFHIPDGDSVQSGDSSRFGSRLPTKLDGEPFDASVQENFDKMDRGQCISRGSGRWPSYSAAASWSSATSDRQDNFLLSTLSSQISLESHLDSSFESSDISVSRSTSFTEANNLSNEYSTLASAVDHDEPSLHCSSEDVSKLSQDLTGASSTISVASRSTVNIITCEEQKSGGRPKSHTISEPDMPQSMALRLQKALKQEKQDVFGPTMTVQQHKQGCTESSSSGDATCPHLWPAVLNKHSQSSKGGKPRRLTIGSALPIGTSLGGGRGSMALHGQHKPSISPQTGHTLQIGVKSSPVHSLGMRDVLTQDQSLTAFQELIDAMKNERPIKSQVIEKVAPAEPESIGAVLEYRPTSPTGHRPEEVAGRECELCGAFARRLTRLDPCGHFACAICCSSGLNQVTATPPRPHVCAACHTPIIGITLRNEEWISEERVDNGPVDGKVGSRKNKTSQSSHRRPLTPSPDEQRLLYRNAVLSSPTKLLGDGGRGNSKAVERRQGAGRTIIAAAPEEEISIKVDDDSGETTTSDVFTEDLSFYQNRAKTSPAPETLCKTPSHKKCPKSSRFPGGARAGINTTRKETQTSPKTPEGSYRSTTSQGTSIVRIDNIPWTLTYNDVIEWLPQPSDCVLPDTDVCSAAIHVPVDVFTGKTSNCCFVECKSKDEAMRLVRHRNNSRLLGRPVSLLVTTLDDLLNEIFPARLDSPSQQDEECIFFTAVHLRHLVEMLCRGGAQLKGPLKIVDVTTSMVRLIPANISRVLSEMLFLRAREIVCICIAASQEVPAMRHSLDRLLLACSNCACFTVSQRIEILDSARGTLTAVTQASEAAVATYAAALLPNAIPMTGSVLNANVNRLALGNNIGHPQRHLRSASDYTDFTLSEYVAAQKLEVGATLRALRGEMVNPVMPMHLPMPCRDQVLNEELSRGMRPTSLPAELVGSSPLATGLVSSPVSGQSLSQATIVKSEYREAAFQMLMGYGVSSSTSLDGFEKMVNQVAQALAKQHLNSGRNGDK